MDKNLFIGREYEIRQLEKYRNSKESEFVLFSPLFSIIIFSCCKSVT